MLFLIEYYRVLVERFDKITGYWEIIRVLSLNSWGLRS